LVEQRIENPRVDGSIPSQATTVAKKCPETARFPGIFHWFSFVLGGVVLAVTGNPGSMPGACLHADR
jgi:hypothetical protein